MARTLAALHAGFAAYKPEHCARLRRSWQDPAYRLKRGIAFAETLRRKDFKKVLTRADPRATWDWYYARQAKRKARLAELRAQVEAARIAARIAHDLGFGKPGRGM